MEECERLSNDKEKIAAACETVWAEKKAGDDMYRQRDLAGAVGKYQKLISSKWVMYQQLTSIEQVMDVTQSCWPT